MKTTAGTANHSWKFILFFSLLSLLFLQLVSDFIESIYAFGLLGTDIPPEIVSILFFFSPLVLLVFKRRLPLRAGLALAGLIALLRAYEVVAAPAAKMLSAGLAVGLLLFLLPLLLSHIRQETHFTAIEIGSGLIIGLALSILLRTLDAGSDISLFVPAISWVLSALMLGLIASLWRIELSPEVEPSEEKPRFLTTLALSIGFLGSLLVLYFAFSSPTVLARWSGLDYRLVVLLVSIATGGFFIHLAYHRVIPWPRNLLAVWNILFLLTGTIAIVINQLTFPLDPAAYPIPQPDISTLLQLPLLLMILLSPVVLVNFSLLCGEIAKRKPSNRQLAGGFAIGAILFLLVVLAQVFTTVYDYIPVVGPWFRDRFWLVFLIAVLSMELPILATARPILALLPGTARRWIVPAVVGMLVISVLVAVLRQPEPEKPAYKPTLKVVTYNLQQGYDADGKRAYHQQLETIRSLQPDVVGLQETDVARFSGGNADLVRLIADGLNMYSYYGPRTVTGTFGIALLSRYPLQNPRTFFMYSKGEQTAAITAEVTINGVVFTVLVTHLGNGGPLIQQQQVLQELRGKENIIAMGDFNFRPDTPQYSLTTETLEDAWVTAGSPSAAGLNTGKLIDHVFISPNVQVQAAEYIVEPISDHPGLEVEILAKPAP